MKNRFHNQKSDDMSTGKTTIDISRGKTTIGNVSGGNIHIGTTNNNNGVEKYDETKTLSSTELSPRVKKGEKILIFIGILAIVVAIIIGLKEEIFAFFK